MVAHSYSLRIQGKNGGMTYAANEIIIGATIRWGRQAIHEMPKNAILKVRLRLPLSRLKEIRATIFKSIRFTIDGLTTFSGVVNAVATELRTNSVIAELQATAAPNILDGINLWQQSFYTINSRQTPRQLVAEAVQNYNEWQTWQVQTPAIDSLYDQRLNMETPAVPSWNAYDALQVFLTVRPFIYPWHTPDFRTWFFTNDEYANQRQHTFDATHVIGDTRTEFDVSNAPMAIDPFATDFYVGDKRPANYSPTGRAHYVYPVEAMFGDEAFNNTQAQLVAATGPSYNGMNVFDVNYWLTFNASYTRIKDVYARQRTPPRELIFDETVNAYPAEVFHTWETGTTYRVDDDELAQALGIIGVYKAIGGTLHISDEGLKHSTTCIWGPQPATALTRWSDATIRWNNAQKTWKTYQ